MKDPLPKEYSKQLKEGKEALAQNNFSLACDIFEDLYASHPDPVSNYGYFQALQGLGLLGEAVDLAHEFPSYYLSQDDRLKLLIRALSSLGDFDQANTWIDKKIQRSKDTDLYEEWLDDLQEKQAASDEEAGKRKELTVRTLYSLADYPLVEALDLLKKAQDFPINDLLSVYHFNLNHPLLDELLKGLILLDIQQRWREGLDDLDWEMIWQGDHVMVTGDDLHSLNEDPLAIDLLTKLEGIMSNDPVLLDLIKDQINLDLVRLYPFHQEVITDVDYWLSLYVDQFSYGPTPQTSEKGAADRLKMDKYFNKLKQNHGGKAL